MAGLGIDPITTVASNVGGVLGDLLVDTSPTTECMIAWMGSAHRTPSDRICGNLSDAFVHSACEKIADEYLGDGTGAGTLLKAASYAASYFVSGGPLGAAGMAAFGASVGGHDKRAAAIEVAAQAGVPGYVCETVIIDGTKVQLYVDASQVPSGGEIIPFAAVKSNTGLDPFTKQWQWDARSAALTAATDVAQASLMPYLGEPEAYAKAVMARKAAFMGALEERKVVPNSYQRPDHRTARDCESTFLGCDGPGMRN